jgi:hypothetical protein
MYLLPDDLDARRPFLISDQLAIANQEDAVERSGQGGRPSFSPDAAPCGFKGANFESIFCRSNVNCMWICST